jgi:uncharacterized protein (UPF0332 family)
MDCSIGVRDDISGMSMFDPEDFLNLAQAMHYSASPNHATLRTVISRAYYAAFLSARDRAGLGDYQGGDIHKSVIDYYLKCRKFTLANRLKSLRERRNKADYDLACEIMARDSGEALRLAREVIKEL